MGTARKHYTAEFKSRVVQEMLRETKTMRQLVSEYSVPKTVVRNRCLRDRIAALTRKTHAFAKHAATWDALLNIQIFEHNWLRAHKALRLPLTASPPRYTSRSPAMALHLTDHIWSWQELSTTPLPYHP